MVKSVGSTLMNLWDDQSLQVLVMDPSNAGTKNTGSMSPTHGAQESEGHNASR